MPSSWTISATLATPRVLYEVATTSPWPSAPSIAVDHSSQVSSKMSSACGPTSRPKPSVTALDLARLRGWRPRAWRPFPKEAAASPTSEYVFHPTSPKTLSGWPAPLPRCPAWPQLAWPRAKAGVWTPRKSRVPAHRTGPCCATALAHTSCIVAQRHCGSRQSKSASTALRPRRDLVAASHSKLDSAPPPQPSRERTAAAKNWQGPTMDTSQTVKSSAQRRNWSKWPRGSRAVQREAAMKWSREAPTKALLEYLVGSNHH
mmetsp:Transcript_3866/g.9150  ORF Transcript_3866/g.9150 Transcript_3866/m.9150 type:complete len:260 (-) Transcript_3866:73-852(-)